MADNAQNIQPQGTQQPVQPIEKPVREFTQVDTSTNAYMEKGDKNLPLMPKNLKDR
jgi:hypothetical protein